MTVHTNNSKGGTITNTMFTASDSFHRRRRRRRRRRPVDAVPTTYAHNTQCGTHANSGEKC